MVVEQDCRLATHEGGFALPLLVRVEAGKVTPRGVVGGLKPVGGGDLDADEHDAAPTIQVLAGAGMRVCGPEDRDQVRERAVEGEESRPHLPGPGRLFLNWNVLTQPKAGRDESLPEVDTERGDVEKGRIDEVIVPRGLGPEEPGNFAVVPIEGPPANGAPDLDFEVQDGIPGGGSDGQHGQGAAESGRSALRTRGHSDDGLKAF